MDAQYINESVGKILTEAITNAILVAAVDPVEYVGQFLVVKSAKKDTNGGDSETK